ncbi:MAG: Gfo/Idh/MocA family oxidoreductase [Candidatus Latescibacterota bacterium]|nr:Gfo/Idh/MocA family oxidoreductase [Candidatus Latescibacterota bacterium]
MATDKIRLGIIGPGTIAPSHAFAIDKADATQLTAVCGRRAEQAAELANQYGVAHYTRVADMLDMVDAITLCTPSGAHLEPALEIIAAGKHLLIEKPLEITTDRIDQIVAAADAKGVVLASVFQSRCAPIAQKLKALIDDGLLGEIYAGSAYIKRYRPQSYYDSGGWRGTWDIDGGGCLINQGIHLTDLLLWFMGAAKEVVGMAETKGRSVEVETLAMGLIRYQSGARGVIEATTLAYPELPEYVEIVGARGTLSFNGSKLQRLDLIDPTPAEAAAKEELLKTSAAIATERERIIAAAPPGTAVPTVDMGHTPVVVDFAEAIRTGHKPLVDGAEGRRSVALITALYESSRNDSQPVKIEA